MQRGRGRTPWRLQPLREAPTLVSPSSGLLRHYSPKNKWLRSGRCVDPSDHDGRRPGVPWPSPRAPNRSDADLRKVLRWRPPSYLQNLETGGNAFQARAVLGARCASRYRRPGAVEPAVQPNRRWRPGSIELTALR
ncbi:hypothetical protein NDU88_001418 [Pleurodeles waltl]|uniref:Uncharacterized protein n=1 Tax=Pleurodeles waltl TaxID=8319 RepID=A0AAV7UTZ6_PLEWA|nr:hypothetical protein NDU88_001418 [Pleurodeles waltl]